MLPLLNMHGNNIQKSNNTQDNGKNMKDHLESKISNEPKFFLKGFVEQNVDKKKKKDSMIS